MKKSIFLFFAALLCATSVCAVETFKDGQYIYFQIEGNSNWTQATYVPKFNWYWDSGNHQSGVLGTEVAGTSKKYYYATVPNAYIGYVQILRMNGSDTNTQWNYSKNLGASSDKTKNCLYFTSASWDNGTMSLKTYAPPMSSVSLKDNGSAILDGNGTSSKPYLIKAGSKIKVKAEGSKAVADPDATIYYNFKQGSTSTQNKTNTTYEFTSSTTAGTTYTINLDGYTKISSTSSTTKSATALYFKTIAPTIKFAGDMTNWGNDAKEFTLNGTTASLDIDLTQGIHEFKIIEIYNSNETWLGNKGQMDRKNCTDWVFRNKKEDKPEEDEINCKILVEVEGTYTFSWDITTHKLSVIKTPEFDLSDQPNTIYFKPSEAWQTASARFAAYFCYGDIITAEKWVNLSDEDGDGVYEVANEKEHAVVIFVRMNPAHNTNKWENDYNWNQTADLFIPTNGNDRYTMKATGADNFDNAGVWSLVKHNISATASPVEGGSIEGANTYNYGTTATLTATANTGYEFVNWTKAGVEISTEETYSFKVTEDVNLVANFEAILYTRTVTVNDWGTICLPYASSSFTGATFYEVSYLIVGTGLWLDQLAADAQLEAGKPYIFYATADEITVTYTGAEAADPVAGANGLTGTFTDIAAGGLTDNYIIAENKVWVAGTGATLSANRAYIDATKVPTTAQTQLPGRRRVQMGENAATGLDNITNGKDVVKTIVNGQLVITIDGVQYNAQGVKF